MTEDGLREFLDANKDSIQDAVKKATIERLIADHKWDISDATGKVVRKFLDDEIMPAVREELASQKNAIIAAAIKSVAQISDDLAQGLIKSAAKNVGDDWRRKEIVKAIFNL